MTSGKRTATTQNYHIMYHDDSSFKLKYYALQASLTNILFAVPIIPGFLGNV